MSSLNVIIMKLLRAMLQFSIVLATLLLSKLSPTEAISCYAYDSLTENVTMAYNCIECRKVYMLFNTSETLEMTQRWQCETDPKASRCPNIENVAASYRADGSSDTRLCTCCTDWCNGLNGFCGPQEPLVQKIKAMIGPKPIEETNGEYAVFEEIEGHLVPKATVPPKPLIYQDIMSCFNDSESSPNKTVTLYGCSECQKTVRKNFETGRIEQSYRCLVSHHAPKCSPYVSATVSTDGRAAVEAFCSCCNDACNDEDFCVIPTMKAPIMARSAPKVKQGEFSLSLPTKITISSVMLLTFMLLAGQKIFTYFKSPQTNN